jgi:hypothetical protein
MLCASNSYKFQVTSDLVQSAAMISGQWVETTHPRLGSSRRAVSAFSLPLHIDSFGQVEVHSGWADTVLTAVAGVRNAAHPPQ